VKYGAACQGHGTPVPELPREMTQIFPAESHDVTFCLVLFSEKKNTK
jgi:hypothetical protein